MNLSAVVLTKNEEKNIKKCLEALSFCDEIIVIDDLSSDKTPEIAQKMKAQVFSHPLNGDFAAQRNYGQEKAQGEWILFVDVDERVTKELRGEVLAAISSQNLPTQKLRGFYLSRRDFIWEKELRHGETANVKFLRLARRNVGRWEGHVHEEWKIKGEVGQLQNPLLHYPHQTIKEFLADINFYTTLRAEMLYQKGIKTRFWKIILYPKAKFISNYFLKGGFLDGIPGFLVAIMMSFHSFLVRGKLWLLWQKK